MDADLYVFAFVAVVAVALYLIVHGIWRKYESTRSEALRSIAPLLGMSFEDGHNIDATQRFGSFHLFSQGGGGTVRNCLSGTIDGVDVTTFGYEYTLSGEGSSTYRQTVVVFRSNELSLPEFELRPRVFSSESYIMYGKDKSAIRHVFSRSVREYFESQKGLFVEGRDENLLCYRREKLTDFGFRGARVRPSKLKSFLDEGRAVFDLFRKKL